MLSSILAMLLLLPLLSFVSSLDNSFIFNGFSSANLALSGVAEITSEGLVKLTGNTKQVQGHAFYPFPLHLKNSSNGNSLSFSTTFVFAIVPEYWDVSSNGITFALSPSKYLFTAMPGQYLGLFNESNYGSSSNHIVAVELDTVLNIEFADINDNHVGIDINGLRSTNSSPARYLDGEFRSLKLISGDPMQVWVEYDGDRMQLDVTLSPVRVPKPRIPIVSSKVNLSSIVLDDMYVGFTSSTGASTGSHYVLGWSFSLNKGEVRALDLSKLPSLPRRHRSHFLSIVLPVGAVIMLLVICSLGLVLGLARRKKKYAELLEDWEIQYGPQRFSYKDLFKATRGFNEENLLGSGGFGKVYKGVLPITETEVAVKRISHESRQGVREFIAEIVSIGRLRHRNLVHLLGYCRRQGELHLVYDFMPNSSLDKFIFDEKKPTLGWNHRFQIIKGVASGILYLHEEWEQVVIHRDIKASNVLLDREFNARLGDFGLARLYDHGTNPRSTHLVGTLGYLPPELSKTGKATTKGDVYAFGAFLLEVACGRRPLEVRKAEEPFLVDWVLDSWKRGGIIETRDPKLGDDYKVREVELVLKLGLLCSHVDPNARPSMRQVMQFLEGDVPLPAIDDWSSNISA